MLNHGLMTWWIYKEYGLRGINGLFLEYWHYVLICTKTYWNRSGPTCDTRPKRRDSQIIPCLHPEATEYLCFETTCNARFSKAYTFHAYLILAYFSRLYVLQRALAQQEWGGNSAACKVVWSPQTAPWTCVWQCLWSGGWMLFSKWLHTIWLVIYILVVCMSCKEPWHNKNGESPNC